MSRRLNVVVCGAGPASQVDRPIAVALADGWTVQVIATPPGLEFIDVQVLGALTGNQVRGERRRPSEPRSQAAAAFIVASATYNTINKLASGANDTCALRVLAEALGLGLPVIVLPFVNSALANREPFKQAVDSLRTEGVVVLIGPGRFEPHEPHAGSSQFHVYPWSLALLSLT